jgi:hypothetical protein
VLFSCLTSPRRAISEPAARSLAVTDRTVEPGFLRPAVELEARRARRALAALTVLDDRPELQPLRHALDDEITGSAVVVTRLIGLAHGRDLGRAVRGLAPGSAGDRGLALETIEVTIGSDLARVVLPLVDPTLDSADRARRLGRFASPGPGTVDRWLREFAHDERDVWQEPWLRVCALYAAPAILGAAAPEFARPFLDDDHPAVAETAGWAADFSKQDGGPGAADVLARPFPTAQSGVSMHSRRQV